MRTIISILLITFITSCGSKKDKIDIDKLTNIYKDILLVRSIEQDTAVANKKIDSVMNYYGYTELQFRKEIFQLSQEDDRLIKLLDSLRTSINREIKAVD